MAFPEQNDFLPPEKAGFLLSCTQTFIWFPQRLSLLPTDAFQSQISPLFSQRASAVNGVKRVFHRPNLHHIIQKRVYAPAETPRRFLTRIISVISRAVNKVKGVFRREIFTVSYKRGCTASDLLLELCLTDGRY